MYTPELLESGCRKHLIGNLLIDQKSGYNLVIDATENLRNSPLLNFNLKV